MKNTRKQKRKLVSSLQVAKRLQETWNPATKIPPLVCKHTHEASNIRQLQTIQPQTPMVRGFEAKSPDPAAFLEPRRFQNTSSPAQVSHSWPPCSEIHTTAPVDLNTCAQNPQPKASEAQTCKLYSFFFFFFRTSSRPAEQDALGQGTSDSQWVWVSRFLEPKALKPQTSQTRLSLRWAPDGLGGQGLKPRGIRDLHSRSFWCLTKGIWEFPMIWGSFFGSVYEASCFLWVRTRCP